MKKYVLVLLIAMFFLLNGCIPEVYEVSFNTDGGNIIENIEVEVGSSVSEPEQPSREGYTFLGWYSDSSKLSVYDFSSPVVGNTTLHADWEINQYTLSFESNGGTTVFSVTEDYGTSLIVPNTPTKEGYTFDKWYIDINLTEEFIFESMPGQDMVLYAGWDANEHPVRYIDWDGTVLFEETFEYGTLLSSVTVQNPERIGYTFVGWDKTIPTNMPNEDITINAEYIANVYEMQFNSNGGSFVETDYYHYNSLTQYPISPSKEGYSFIGWYLDENLTNEFTFSRMPAEDVELYAKWEINEYAIVYLD